MNHQLSWYKKTLYKISFHADVNKALKDAQERGKAIGRKEVQPILYMQSCKACSAPLTELEPGLYECPLCRGRNTGPMLASRPGALMMAERARLKREKPELTVDTQQMASIRLKNHSQKLYQVSLPRLTVNLALINPDDVPTQVLTEKPEPKGERNELR